MESLGKAELSCPGHELSWCGLSATACRGWCSLMVCQALEDSLMLMKSDQWWTRMQQCRQPGRLHVSSL